MNGAVESALPPDFQWSPEYDQVLETLASSDYVQQDWDKLRDMIKYKLKENITSYLSDPPPPPPPEPPAAPEQPAKSPESASTVTTQTLSPGVIPTTGAKFPPFPKREENQFVRNEFNSYGRQKAVLTEQEANEGYERVCRLLYEFEGIPPFTIQRLCELINRPRQHFKYSGKYLRAVERSLLVTSTIDAFPVISPEEITASSSPFMSIGSLREATTPLFSPIPFLHEDARRSRSRSPPMSPLSLATSTARPLSPNAESLHLGPAAAEAVGSGMDTPVIGLVDELDDPGPGHLSDHPTAISSTTTMTTESSAESTTLSAPATGKPLFGGSLQERFVKSTGTEAEANTGPDHKEVPASAQSQSSASAAAAESSSSTDSSSGDASKAANGGAGSDSRGEAVNMAVDETDADKENVPKS